MATKQIAWGDGTSDVITVSYTGTAGSSQVSVSSSMNKTRIEREESFKIAIGEIVYATIKVVQNAAGLYHVIVDANNKYLIDGNNVALSTKVERPKSFMVEFAGLLWDKDNIEINGQRHFDQPVAAQIASDFGKRLPTPAEIEFAITKPWLWDYVNYGLWLADNITDLKDPEKSIFLPAWGYGSLQGVYMGQSTYYGYIWSSEDGVDMRVDSGGPSKQIHGLSSYGFSIRCVKSL